MSAVELHNIVKRFPGVLACDGATLTLSRGEIHALVGENGAGKSTLMKILCGLYAPDEGTITVGGKLVHFGSPRDAVRHGIGMVHQHYSLVATLTVLENVLLGLEQPRFLFKTQLAAVEKKLAELCKTHGLDLDLRAYIWQLSVGEQQRVEILKLLYRGAEVLIFDEPTAVLSPREAAGLHQALRDMARGGRSVIYISHKLDEVFALADRVTVLRRGRVVATATAIAETTRDAIAAQMIGRAEIPTAARPDRVTVSAPTEAPMLDVRNLSALGDLGRDALRQLTLQVKRGEIYGLAGVAGNGQRELVEVLTGVRPARSGHVQIEGRDVTNSTPAQRIAAGLACIPEDCAAVAAAPALSVLDNLLLKHYQQRELGLRALPFVLDPVQLRRRAESILQRFDLPPQLCEVRLGTLSGGNLQKIILARELSTQPRVLIAAYPCRGLDLGAMEIVHRLLLEARAEGAAVLLISEELDELLRLADRIGVLFHGSILGEVLPGPNSRESLGRMLGGLAESREEGAA